MPRHVDVALPLLLVLGALISAVVAVVLYATSGGSFGSIKRAEQIADANRRAITSEIQRQQVGLPPNPLPTLERSKRPTVALMLSGALLLGAAAIQIADPTTVRLRWDPQREGVNSALTQSTSPPQPTSQDLRTGDCLNQRPTAGHSYTISDRDRVPCKSDAAAAIVLADASNAACGERQGSWAVVNGQSICVRTLVQAGMCVPAWVGTSRVWAYFAASRSCDDSMPDDLQRPQHARDGRFGVLEITVTTPLYDKTLICRGRRSNQWRLKEWNLRVCTKVLP